MIFGIYFTKTFIAEVKKEADRQNSEEDLEKTSLLISLENSRSFARTHEMIEKLSQYTT